MRRRALLTSFGTVVAALPGCTMLDSDETPLTQTDTTDTTTGASTPTRTEEPSSEENEDGLELSYASIVDLQTVPRTYALAPTQYRTADDASVTLRFTKTATSEHPATIEATLSNENQFANTFQLDWLPPFGRLTSRIPHEFGRQYDERELTYRAGLLLVPTANYDLVENPPTVERDSNGIWRVERTGDWLSEVPETHRLEPGEELNGEFALVGHPEGVDTGRPTGVYEFRSRNDNGIRVSVWDTENPGPSTRSRFAGAEVPAFHPKSETAWYHEADSTTPSYVRPSTERGSLPEQIRFVYVNKSREATSCGHWNLYKLVDGSWYHIGPYVHTSDCRYAFPGEAVTWTLHAYPGEALPTSGGTTSVGYLGAGRYAVVAGYSHAVGGSAALVEFTGDPVELVPTEDVSASHAGGTVRVTSPRHETSGDHPTPATLTVTRTEAEPAETLIREQVMRRRFRGLRNTLAFFESGVDEVVLETNDRVAEDVVGYDSETMIVELDGQRYRLTMTRESA
jgi:hypothetical protein